MIGVNLSKTSHILFFIVFGGVLAVVSSWLLSQFFALIFLNNTTPFWIETLSPLGAYGLFYWVFDSVLWKFPIFETLGIVCVPNLNGRWIGIQRSTYKDADGNNIQVSGVLEIRQTFSSISVNAYYEKSESASKTAGFASNNGICYLYYTYDNEPNALIEGTMQMHKGTVKLNYIEDEKKICGTYFNSIGNRGDMMYKLEQFRLKNRF